MALCVNIEKYEYAKRKSTDAMQPSKQLRILHMNLNMFERIVKSIHNTIVYI